VFWLQRLGIGPTAVRKRFTQPLGPSKTSFGRPWPGWTILTGIGTWFVLVLLWRATRSEKGQEAFFRAFGA